MTRSYITARTATALERSLSVRDRIVLATLARVRVATSGQLERACYSDLTRRRARQSLSSLTDRRLLARLARSVGGSGGGSGRFVYVLDVAGQRLSRRDGRRPARPWHLGVPFLAHGLAVTEVYVRLVEAGRAGRLDLIGFTGEPACWHSFSGPGGRVTLKPDAHVTVGLGRYEDRWFIEVDRGTESTTTIARKCETYRRYWQSGTEQARTGFFPRVLWLVPDQHRYDQLVQAMGKQPAQAWQLFVVAHADDVVARIIQGAQV